MDITVAPDLMMS